MCYPYLQRCSGKAQEKLLLPCKGSRIVIGVLALILFLSTQTGQAQDKLDSGSIKVFGYVRDVNGAPIKDAYVGGTEINTGSYASAATNEEGYYEFQVDQNGTYHFDIGRCNWSKSPYVNDYIPVLKIVEIGVVTEVNVDFSLRPAANIILHAYDNQGKLLRNKKLTTATSYHQYVTDLKSTPQYGCYRPLHDATSEKHSYNPDLMLPNFVVSPGDPNQIHLLWEIPKFGKVKVSVDNGGKGYKVGKQGGTIILNFNHEAAKSKLASFQKDYDLCLAQGYALPASVKADLALTKQHLAKAEGYLKASSPNMKKAVAELNTSMRITSLAHETLLLKRAKSDIEKYRKGNITITVVDDQGNPVPDCDISYKQISHDFLFGASGLGWSDDRYKWVKLLKEAGINYTYQYHVWKIAEPEAGKYDWSGTDWDIDTILAKGLSIEGDMFVTMYRDAVYSDDFTPHYWDNMTIDKLNENVFYHMVETTKRYKGKFSSWETGEQNCSFSNALGLTWNQKLDVIKAFSDGIRKVDPTAKIQHLSHALGLEFALPRAEDLDDRADKSIPYYEFLPVMMEKDIPVDIIGLEFINGSGSPQKIGLDLVTISQLLDLFHDFNLPIYIHEFLAPSCQAPGEAWWHRPWDEKTQAEYIRSVFTIGFGKPLVQELAYSYGVSDVEGFVPCSGLLDVSDQPKPSYYALKNLIRSWTTKSKGKTDANGQLMFRGFAGDYKVTVSLEGNPTITAHISEQKDSNYTIKVPITLE